MPPNVRPLPVNVHYLNPLAAEAHRAEAARIRALYNKKPEQVAQPVEDPTEVYTPPSTPVVKTSYEKLQDTLSTYISNLRVPTVKTIKTIFGGEVPSKEMEKFDAGVLNYLDTFLVGSTTVNTVDSALDRIHDLGSAEYQEKAKLVIALWKKYRVYTQGGGRRKVRKTRRARKARKTRKNRRS
jgi:hypothetical protein